MIEAYQIVKEMYYSYVEDSVMRMQIFSWLDILLAENSVEGLRQQFESMLSFVCTKLGRQFEKSNENIVEEVMNYIEEHYMDSNLNITTLADEMNYNFRHLSKVFKEEKGEGILDYINTLRIRKAQEILLTREVSVEEAGEMVGYASTRTFRRNFTKIVGMTPGRYQEGI